MTNETTDDEATSAPEAEDPDDAWFKGLLIGKKQGREEAWHEAIAMVSKTATGSYMANGDNPTSRLLRELALEMMRVRDSTTDPSR